MERPAKGNKTVKTNNGSLLLHLRLHTAITECYKNLNPSCGTDKDNKSERRTTKSVEGAVKPASKTEH